MKLEYQNLLKILIDEVNDLVLNNQSDDCLKIIAEDFEHHPNSAALYYIQGFLYDKIGKSNDAKIYYEKAYDVNPDYFLGIEVYNKAVEMLNSVNDTASKDNETTVATALKQLKIAIDYLEKAHKNAPQDGYAESAMMNSYIGVINFYIETNQSYSALEYLAKAIA